MFLPPSLFSATHRTRSCPAALFDLHSVFAALVRSTALPRRPGVTSPACIISGDGYSVVEVLFGFVTVFFIDNPQSPC